MKFRYKLTWNELLDKAKLKHNNKYEYSEPKEYNILSYIDIICPIHGVFNQQLNKHINVGQGCPLCKGGIKYTLNEFIEKSKLKHNNLYSYDNVIYVNSKTKVSITCKIHGDYKQRPCDHLSQGHGCPLCSNNVKHTSDKFIEISRYIHKDKYDYNKVNYLNNNSKVEIICNKHGSFTQTPYNHKLGKGCPKCKNSHGELLINNFLSKNGINFITEKKFKDLKYRQHLRFDFYLPEYNTCIEYNGQQHYRIIEIFGGETEFSKIKIRDNLKIEYCKINNINLLIIKYDENIEEKITNYLNEI
jgi:hypothetical protein